MASDFDSVIAGTAFEECFEIFEDDVVYRTAAGTETTIKAITDFRSREDTERAQGSGRVFVDNNTITVYNADVAAWEKGARFKVGDEWFGIERMVSKDANRTRFEIKKQTVTSRGRSTGGDR